MTHHIIQNLQQSQRLFEQIRRTQQQQISVLINHFRSYLSHKQRRIDIIISNIPLNLN